MHHYPLRGGEYLLRIHTFAEEGNIALPEVFRRFDSFPSSWSFHVFNVSTYPVLFKALVVIFLCFLAWTSGSAVPHDRVPPRFATVPAVMRNPNPRVPFASIVTFASDEPAAVALQVNDGRVFYADGELRTEHAVAVLGLRAAERNQVRIFLIDGAVNR